MNSDVEQQDRSHVFAMLQWLGLIFGCLSVVKLTEHAFDVGFVASLRLLLEYYDAALTVVFAPIELAIRQALLGIRAFLGIEVGFSPTWKYLLVLLLSVVGAISRQFAVATMSVRTFAIGAVIALLLSVVWGIAIWSASHPELINWLPHEWRRWSDIIGLIILFSLPVVAVLWLDTLVAIERPRRLFRVGGIVIFIALTFGAAVYANLFLDGPDNDVSITYFISMASVVSYALFLLSFDKHNAKVGSRVVATFGAACLFLLTNAGLKLAGL